MIENQEDAQRVTRTFPHTHEQEVDPVVFRELLQQALDELLHMWEESELTPTYLNWTVWQPNDGGGLTSSHMPIPNYLRESTETYFKEAMLLPGISKFIEYLWEKGRHGLSLTGLNPTREAWELCVLNDELAIPLRAALTRAAIDQAVETGTALNWTLSRPFYDDLVNDLVHAHSFNVKRFAVKCPLFWANGEEWDLGGGVRLKSLNLSETAKYLTEVEGRVTTFDLVGSLMSDVAMLEFKIDIKADEFRQGKPPKTGIEIVEEIISDRIDVAKWAIFAGGGCIAPLIEGVTSYREIASAGLYGLGILRRVSRRNKQGIFYHMTQERLEKTRACFDAANKYSEISKAYSQAIWYWGRACLASLDRDKLLESVIGLERLLIENPGESRYRFSLYGTALLCDEGEDAKEKSKELKSIYDGRSNAAHGGARKLINEKELGSLAFKTLGQVINVITGEFESRKLDPTISVATQIEEIVYKSVAYMKNWSLE